jgi:hypothetical protein
MSDPYGNVISRKKGIQNGICKDNTSGWTGIGSAC